MNRLWILGLSSILVACGSDTTNPNDGGGSDGGGGMDSGGGVDSGGGMDSGGNMDSGGGMDAGKDSGRGDAGFMLNGCTDGMFVDKSNGNQAQRTIDPWSLIGTFPVCMIISKGQSVQWNASPSFASFGGHPLQPMGGDTPNPIMSTTQGTTVTFQFPNTGNYGFNCVNHPGIMQGVIRVKN